MTATGSTKPIVIFSQRLAGYLMQRGFVLMGMRGDTDHPQRNVFLFKDSPELNIAMSEYLSHKR